VTNCIARQNDSLVNLIWLAWWAWCVLWVYHGTWKLLENITSLLMTATYYCIMPVNGSYH